VGKPTARKRLKIRKRAPGPGEIAAKIAKAVLELEKAQTEKVAQQ